MLIKIQILKNIQIPNRHSSLWKAHNGKAVAEVRTVSSNIAQIATFVSVHAPQSARRNKRDPVRYKISITVSREWCMNKQCIFDLIYYTSQHLMENIKYNENMALYKTMFWTIEDIYRAPCTIQCFSKHRPL